MATQTPAFKLHEELVTDIIDKLKTMGPYLERSSDLQLRSQLRKIHNEVDNLYNSWLQGRDTDIEVASPPFEEDWVEDESDGEDYYSEGTNEARNEMGIDEEEQAYSQTRDLYPPLLNRHPSPPQPQYPSTSSPSQTTFEYTNTTTTPTQPNFQIKGLASNLAPIPTKPSRKMQRRLQYEAQTTKGTFIPVPRVRQDQVVHTSVGGRKGLPRGLEQEEGSVYQQQQYLRKEREVAAAQTYEVQPPPRQHVDVQEVRPQPVSAWALAELKEEPKDAAFDMEKSAGGW